MYIYIYIHSGGWKKMVSEIYQTGTRNNEALIKISYFNSIQRGKDDRTSTFLIIVFELAPFVL